MPELDHRMASAAKWLRVKPMVSGFDCLPPVSVTMRRRTQDPARLGRRVEIRAKPAHRVKKAGLPDQHAIFTACDRPLGNPSIAHLPAILRKRPQLSGSVRGSPPVKRATSGSCHIAAYAGKSARSNPRKRNRSVSITGIIRTPKCKTAPRGTPFQIRSQASLRRLR